MKNISIIYLSIIVILLFIVVFLTSWGLQLQEESSFVQKESVWMEGEERKTIEVLEKLVEKQKGSIRILEDSLQRCK